MCLRHWRMVPRDLQRAVLAAYMRGQENGAAPVTAEYLKAARAAIRFVAAAEPGRP